MMAGLSPAAATAGSRWILHLRLCICINCVGSAFYGIEKNKTKIGYTKYINITLDMARFGENEDNPHRTKISIGFPKLPHSRFSHRNPAGAPPVCGSPPAFRGFCAPVCALRATSLADGRGGCVCVALVLAVTDAFRLGLRRVARETANQASTRSGVWSCGIFYVGAIGKKTRYITCTATNMKENGITFVGVELAACEAANRPDG